jgi:hypothetical protein
MWTKNVVDAVAKGQILLIVSRYHWQNRTEERNYEIKPEENLSWPNKGFKFTEGQPISQYGMAQEREIEWIKKQGFPESQVVYMEIQDVVAGASKSFEGLRAGRWGAGCRALLATLRHSMPRLTYLQVHHFDFFCVLPAATGIPTSQRSETPVRLSRLREETAVLRMLNASKFGIPDYNVCM